MAGCASLGLFIWKWLVRLLDMMLVLFVLLIILSLVFQWDHSGRDRDSSLAKLMIKAISATMGHYRTEYNRYPVPASETQFLRTEGTLLLSLQGQDKESNPRGIMFIELLMAHDGKNGLTEMKENGQTTPSTTTLTDPWGEKYYLLIEADGDDRIPNPERRPEAIYKRQASAPEFLNSSVIIFSSGPDRDPKTWDDNICSWR
jgi:hypothetical protein